MSKLLQRLSDPSRSGVYGVAEGHAIEDALRGSGFDLGHISLRGAQSKEALLERLGAAMAFPVWFGGNWDAAEDCLADLSWREGEGHVLLFSEAQPSEDLSVLVDVLRSSAEFWQERGTPFFAVFIDPGRRLRLPELYRPR
jgi:hypothetical protein